MKKILKDLKCYHEETVRLISELGNITPFRQIMEYKDRISLMLELLCIAGAIYWFYKLFAIDAKPHLEWLVTVDDPREAMVFLIFGAFGIVVVSFPVLFILKLIYNCLHSGAKAFVPEQWYTISKSIALLICLNIGFTYIDNIKAAGLTAHAQVNRLFQRSIHHSPIVKKDIDLLKLLDRLDAVSKEESR